MCFGGSKPKVVQQTKGYGTPVDDPSMDSSRDSRLRYQLGSNAQQPGATTLGASAAQQPSAGLGGVAATSSQM